MEGLLLLLVCALHQRKKVVSVEPVSLMVRGSRP